MRVDEQLRELLKDENRLDIYKFTGVDPAILSRFVNGKRSLQLKTFVRLCKYFNLELIEK